MTTTTYMCAECKVTYTNEDESEQHDRSEYEKETTDVTNPVWDSSGKVTMSTSEFNKLLEDEEDIFVDAVKELERNVGINDSIIDWFNVEFQSDFIVTAADKDIEAES
jgi:hypothetical protein